MSNYALEKENRGNKVKSVLKEIMSEEVSELRKDF